MRVCALVILLSIAGTFRAPAAERTPRKENWEWTLDERLAGRFDPEQIRERRAAYDEWVAKNIPASAFAGKTPPQPNPPGTLEYSIDGRRNPELFLPHELFDSLLSGLAPDESRGRQQRAFYRAALRRLGYDDAAFWPALESVSAAYIVIQQKTCTEPTCAVLKCTARFQALESARRLFGRSNFDRLLYQVVAPQSQFAVASTDPHYVDTLRQAEEGCR